MYTTKRLTPRRLLGLCAFGWLGLTSACSGWPFEPVATATPQATATAIPTRTPQPTWTVRPTWTAQPTWTPVARATAQPPQIVTVVVTATAAPRKSLKPRPVIKRTPVVPNSAWFFEPHPPLPLRNPFRYTVEMQVFERGIALYLHEKRQTWVFGAPGMGDVAGRVWSNRAGDLQTVADAFQLGPPKREPQRWQACAGDTEQNGFVTAYMLLPDKRVLSWTIRAVDFAPQAWAYLDPAETLACTTGASHD